MRQNIGRFFLSLALIFGIGAFSYSVWRSGGAKESNNSFAAVETPRKADSYELGSTKKDVTYCNGQLMDIYRPRIKVYDASPVILYFHGGGWVLNDKSSEPDQLAMIDGLRDNGYTVAAINYRKLPNGYYQDAVQDSLCSVRYLRAQAKSLGIDPSKIAIYGFSAGGYLAGMVAALPDDSVFESPEYTSFSSRVNAVITLAGIFDFTDGLNDGNRQRIANFLNGADPAVAEVTAYISPDDPPFMLPHGAEDQYVPVEQDNNLAILLQQNDIPYEQIYITGADHGLNPTGGQSSPDRSTVTKRMVEFLDSRLFSN